MLWSGSPLLAKNTRAIDSYYQCAKQLFQYNFGSSHAEVFPFVGEKDGDFGVWVIDSQNSYFISKKNNQLTPIESAHGYGYQFNGIIGSNSMRLLLSMNPKKKKARKDVTLVGGLAKEDINPPATITIEGIKYSMKKYPYEPSAPSVHIHSTFDENDELTVKKHFSRYILQYIEYATQITSKQIRWLGDFLRNGKRHKKLGKLFRESLLRELDGPKAHSYFLQPTVEIDDNLADYEQSLSRELSLVSTECINRFKAHHPIDAPTQALIDKLEAIPLRIRKALPYDSTPPKNSDERKGS